MAADRTARFEEIYNEYSMLILAYAARRTADAHDAADVLAETFVVAWRRIDEVPPGEDARPWLYGVARWVLANHHRGNRRRQSLDERLVADVARTVADATADRQADHSDVAAAFAQLSDGDRELLTMVAWDGLGRDEIASILGCNRAAVRLRLYRARRRLEQLLAIEAMKRSTGSGHGARRWAAASPDQEDA